MPFLMRWQIGLSKDRLVNDLVPLLGGVNVVRTYTETRAVILLPRKRGLEARLLHLIQLGQRRAGTAWAYLFHLLAAAVALKPRVEKAF
jgi:hypothetical protein